MELAQVRSGCMRMAPEAVSRSTRHWPGWSDLKNGKGDLGPELLEITKEALEAAGLSE